MIESIIVHGLTLGCLLSLLAAGMVLVFSVARLANLSYTALYMVAAYMVFTFVQHLNLNLFLAYMLSVLFTVGLALFLYIACIHPVREHHFSVMVVTVALALVLQELVTYFYKALPRSVPTLIGGYVTMLGVRVLAQQIVVYIGTIITLACLTLWLRKSTIGTAIRAVANDTATATLMGINVSKIYLIVVMVSAALAAVSAILATPLVILEPYMWTHPLIMVIAIVILGGMGSLRGAVIGAFIIAFAEVVFVHLVPIATYLRGIVAMIAILIVLVIRPEGLFGIRFETER